MASRTSRKKNKGKERKAKKVEVERTRKRNEWLLWATGDEKVVGKTITCDHGCGAIPNDLDHPVLCFLDEFSGQDKNMGSLVDASETINGETVLNNSMYRKMLIDIMIRMGTNMLLLSEGKHDIIRALTLAKAIAMLERYVDVGSDILEALKNREVGRKMRDLNSGSMRDGLKFFSKRVQCSCLKKMYQEARKILPKMDECLHCEKEFERVALSVCSRCMVTQYCSRECQVAHWPTHGPYCAIITCNVNAY